MAVRGAAGHNLAAGAAVGRLMLVMANPQPSPSLPDCLGLASAQGLLAVHPWIQTPVDCSLAHASRRCQGCQPVQGTCEPGRYRGSAGHCGPLPCGEWRLPVLAGGGQPLLLPGRWKVRHGWGGSGTCAAGLPAPWRPWASREWTPPAAALHRHLPSHLNRCWKACLRKCNPLLWGAFCCLRPRAGRHTLLQGTERSHGSPRHN